MLLSKRFKKFREELGLSQKDISILLECTTGKIKQIERDITKSISYDDAKKIEKVHKVREQWLRFGRGEMLIDDSLVGKIEEYETELELNNNLITLPYFENIKASAGCGYINNDEKPSSIKLPTSLVPTSDKHLEIIKVDGDSMEETISNDDLIFVDKNSTEPINGKIYIVRYEDELYIKRYFNMTNEIILRSDNKYYPDIKPKENEQLEICGKVVGRLSKKDLV